MFEIIKYKNFPSYLFLDKTINFLRNGDFKSAQTKKLVNTNLFRAKLNYEDRLIFTFLKYKNKTYILLLEIILNHEYEKSQFLNGKKIDEEEFVFEPKNIEEINFLNEKKEVSYLNKFISFDENQENIINLNPPLLVIGSAGSGKTSITLEKLKYLQGNGLYISFSKYLTENSKKLCKECKNIDFLSFKEFLNKIELISKKEINFQIFYNFAKKSGVKTGDIEKYFEEFKGVLLSTYGKKYISKEEYLNLGIKQSLFLKEEREKVYKVFERYLEFLEKENYYDNNLIIFELFEKVKKRYDFVVIDEVQDFTNKEIFFILKSLKNEFNFILSGDANQIIYSNFFSWANLKSMLIHLNNDNERKIINKILTHNYRNSQKIINISNQLLKIKQLQFGSIDKESNYLIHSNSNKDGEILFYKTTHKSIIKEINNKTYQSVEFAVIVFDEVSKKEAKKHFKTPLIFTIREAKGLEYKNIILFNFISDNETKFYDIVSNISKEDLIGELKYSRPKDKTDKTLDKYKIYINSFYVALTRGIENIYIFEKKEFKILELLGIIETKKVNISTAKSSKDEWLEEAKKLEESGRVEQSSKIIETYKINNIENKLNKKTKIQKEREIKQVIKHKRKFKNLIQMVVNKQYEKVKNYLINKNADPNVIMEKKDEIKRIKILITPLFIAIQNKDFEMIKLLVENGADINQIVMRQSVMLNGNKHKNFHNVLFFAFYPQFYSEEIIEYLLTNGGNLHQIIATVTINNEFNLTPKYDIFNMLMTNEEEFNQDLETIKFVSKFIDKTHIYEPFSSPIVTSIMGDNIEITKFLLKNKLFINDKNLVMAVFVIITNIENKNQQKQFLNLLFEYSFDINEFVEIGNQEITLLMAFAEYKEDKEVFKFLLEKGADINIKNKDNKTVFDFAKDEEIRKILRNVLWNKNKS